MVHVKRVELSNFKSFGGTTSIPLLPGFTVVSGPNGSGKSNILDALLFCLGLASSKGMRAERLPDLVNHNHANHRNTSETIVAVTFDLSDLALNEVESQQSAVNGNGHLPQDDRAPITALEWTVTRRLRVTKGGSYSSTYYINDELCTVTELHEQLNRLRIYPEGYNVVLQGDVTSIISMNARERREIIDELAGVAEFDRKIDKTKETLESVREREERCEIITQELQRSLEKLAADRLKAEKYQKLKAQIQEKQQWEAVLTWKLLQQQQTQLEAQIRAGEAETAQLQGQLSTLVSQIREGTTALDRLNQQVKALGEEEQLSVASKLATQQAKRQQLQQRQHDLETARLTSQLSIKRTQEEIEQYQKTLTHIDREKVQLETDIIPSLEQQRDRTKVNLENSREEASSIAEASQAWVQEQTALSRQITTLQDSLNPKRTQQAQLNERDRQLEKTLAEQAQRLANTEQELTIKQGDEVNLSAQLTLCQEQIQTLAEQLADAEQQGTLQEDTHHRLLKEQREKQRQLDKLEATKQAQQEAQGTYATQVILQSDLPGVCGLVAQLGQVESRYQLALETAAGGRLGHLVVEDDSVAAAGIELLKQTRAGRATFLPLNKIQSPRSTETATLRYANGFIDFAANLVDCEPRYRHIFAYVFGGTIVFATLDDARPYLGKHRMVTLEGDMLESSGAMSGGSRPTRASIHFGTVMTGESEEIKALRTRLSDIEKMLSRHDEVALQKNALVKQLSQELTEWRQKGREQQLHLEQVQKEIQRLTTQKEELTTQIAQNRQELANVRSSNHILTKEIPLLEAELQAVQQQLTQLEESQTQTEWHRLQKLIKEQDRELQEQEEALRQAEAQLREIQNKYQRLDEKILESQQRILDYQQQESDNQTQELDIQNEIKLLEEKISETEALLQQLSAKLGETKQERDRAEKTLREFQNQQQQQSWQLQKLQETQQERQLSLQTLQEKIQLQQSELPDPLPNIPELTSETETQESLVNYLEQLQKDLRNAQKRLESMEPVNMLALEEYERTQQRLEELAGKLGTLAEERTELLLRIENFTTLRFRAFKEAFDAVNQNFETIFATLSEGDGHLQLDDPEDPFNGGLNLVAHPKGKPVQRLSSMSGGEKSLTALSFIFALQRYRPSPFYAFDEVDMFLDGANVERLSKMIQKQAQQAQFIVVSLRRPMIEASERTIGVTQARGAYTQVLGIKI